jgi:hypothetical protein
VVLIACAKLLRNSLSVFLAARDEPVAVWTDEETTEHHIPLRGASQLQPPATLRFGYRRPGQWDYEDKDGIDGAVHLIDLHHKARRALGLTRASHRYELPCPRCEGQLSRVYGSNTIDCDNCDRRYSIDEYEHLCLLLARRTEA